MAYTGIQGAFDPLQLIRSWHTGGNPRVSPLICTLHPRLGTCPITITTIATSGLASMAKEIVDFVIVGGIAVVVLGLVALNRVEKLSKKTNSSRSSTKRDTTRNIHPSGARRNTTTVQSNTTTDHQPATTMRRDTTRHDSVYKIDPQTGGLFCNMKCLLIGSFGDELAPGVKVIPKRFCKPIGPYLPGVKQDLETMNSKIQGDPYKTITWSLVDYPEDQRPKEEYLQKIEEFLTQCETPGGEAFTQLM